MPDGDPLIAQASQWGPVVPELRVADLASSVEVYTDLFGFERVHVETGRLVVLALGAGQLILRQGSDEEAEVEPARVPLLHLRLSDPSPVYERLRKAKYPIETPMEKSELTVGEATWTETSFVVADPDGYLLRFAD